MLHPPPRPRAPSTATLRILYQLAYISSGTALGVGALCAEERRRRTQVVQKVADNARRLRQSPRYAHAAAARVAQEDGGDEMAWWGAEGAVKGEEMPSVVQKGYEQYLRGDGRRANRKTRAWRPEFVEEHGNGQALSRSGDEQVRPEMNAAYGTSRTKTGPSSSGRLVTGKSSRHRGLLSERSKTRFKPESASLPQRESKVLSTRTQSRRVGSQIGTPIKGNHLQPTTGGLADPSPDGILYRRRTSFGQTPRDTPFHKISNEPQLFHNTVASHSLPADEALFKSAADRFATRYLWRGSSLKGASDLESPGVADLLKKDVDLFFQDVAYGTRSKLTPNQACHIAEELLGLSLDYGELEEVESLLLWKSAVNHLDFTDMRATIASFAKLADQDAGRALQLCLDLFATRAYTLLLPRHRLGLQAALLIETMHANLITECEGLVEQWIDQDSIRGCTDKVEQLTSLCLEVKSRSTLAITADVFCLALNRQRGAKFRPLFDQLFAMAIDEGWLSQAAKLLRAFTACASSKEDLSGPTHGLIQLCAQAGAYRMLEELFKERLCSKKPYLNHLSEASCMHLGRAFSHDAAIFNRLYRRCSKHGRFELATSHTATRVAVLKSTWELTRNLDQVERQYRMTIADPMPKDTASQGSVDEATHEMRMALCEIQIYANKPELALQTLASFSGFGSKCHVASLIALSFAKSNKWQAFQEVFEILKQYPDDCNWTIAATQVFNEALRLYSKCHSAEEASALARKSILEFGFPADQSTFQILLSCFVSKNSLELIRHWLTVPEELGLGLKVDSYVVASLVARWYRDARHSHVLVMWTCRQIAKLAPSASGQQLLNVVKEAFSYDIRNLHGINAPWMKHVIFARQALVESSDESFPRPGYVWGNVLYGDSEKPLSTDPDQSNWDELKAASFPDSRTMYLSGPVESGTKSKPRSTRTEMLEGSMLSDLSRGSFEPVLDAYTRSCDATGLPKSPRTLELAVDATLQSSGGQDEANKLLSAASKAGMNIYSAMAPLLIHRMQKRDCRSSRDVRELRKLVMSYYRANERNGLHVRHDVGTHAAHTIMQAGFPELAVNLLDTIFRSEWSTKQPLDTAPMSVWLHCYSALGNMEGIRWVVKTVLDSDLPIDQSFIRVLRRAERPRVITRHRTTTYTKRSAPDRAQIQLWLGECREKRAKQLWKSRVFGRKLVHLLARAVNNGGLLPPIEASATTPGSGGQRKFPRVRRPLQITTMGDCDTVPAEVSQARPRCPQESFASKAGTNDVFDNGV